MGGLKIGLVEGRGDMDGVIILKNSGLKESVSIVGLLVAVQVHVGQKFLFDASVRSLIDCGGPNNNAGLTFC